MASGPAPTPPRQGNIWWSVAPPVAPEADDADRQVKSGISEEQLHDWLSCTTGWKALELTWGALASCEVRYHQLKPLLQAAMAEAARLGAPRLVVRQLDIDEVLGRCLGLALSGFPNFTALKLRELNLYDEALGHLSGALHSAEHLRLLVLDSVWASVGGWSALGAAIKVNNSLTALRMRQCLGTDGAALTALCSALADQHGCLEALRLSHNGLGDAGVEELCKALTRSHTQPASRPTRVAHLDLSYNEAGRQCVPAVATMLRTVRALRHLDLSYNDLGAEAVRDLCVALWYAPHVTSLNLAATGADDSTVEALTRGSLAPPNPLTAAASGLSGTGGGGGGALATLNLGHNRISARGSVQLAAAARRPGCPLVELDLAGNALVGEEGAKAWAEVLAPSSSSYSSLSSASSLVPAVAGGAGGGAGGCRLRRLVLSGCEVTDAAAFALGAALKTNTSLQELGLAENHISTRGLALLAEVLKVNSTLRLLDVSLNMVGPQGMTPFTRMSHLRGHVVLSKGGDPRVQRVSSCVVKAELLREYRQVEAVKNSREPWEQEEQQRRVLGSYQNPFLDPSTAAAAAASSSAQGGGGSYNPFLSPSATYVNPFLDTPSRTGPQARPGVGGVGVESNPFFEQGRSAASNPFLAEGPQPVAAATAAGKWAQPDNPFLSPAAVEDNPFLAAGVTKGTEVSASAASAAGDGDGGADGDGRGSGSDTAVYVSSRSTADEADLVTDLDLRLVDYLLENLGVTAGEAATTPNGATAASAETADDITVAAAGSSSSNAAAVADRGDRSRNGGSAAAGTAGGWGAWGGGQSDPSMAARGQEYESQYGQYGSMAPSGLYEQHGGSWGREGGFGQGGGGGNDQLPRSSPVDPEGASANPFLSVPLG